MPKHTNAKSNSSNGSCTKKKIEKSRTKALLKPPVQSQVLARHPRSARPEGARAGAGPHHGPAARPERATLAELNARRPRARACARAKARATPPLGTAVTSRTSRVPRMSLRLPSGCTR